MIGWLCGRLVRKAPDALIVDAHGVGYRVFVSLNTFYALPGEGAQVELEIHTHLRENALELFGFADPVEKALFTSLLAVSGIGPRMALNILSGIPPVDLLDALRAGDVARLVAVPGVGKKTAERLVVELHDRVRSLGDTAPLQAGSRNGLETEATSALVNLGYRQPQAERAVRDVMRQGANDLGAVIREALQRLSA
jgi:Holliday junction DNA helicase RuvA